MEAVRVGQGLHQRRCVASGDVSLVVEVDVRGVAHEVTDLIDMEREVGELVVLAEERPEWNCPHDYAHPIKGDLWVNPIRFSAPCPNTAPSQLAHVA